MSGPPSLVRARYDFNTIMSFVGANMGLWLGIGGLQILRCIEVGFFFPFISAQ